MTAGIIVIGLMIAGLILLVIELVVLPGFGIIGAFGLLAVIGSGYLAVTQLDPAWAALAIVAGVAASGGLLWLFPRTRAARAMVLKARTLGSAGDATLGDLVDCEGIALTPLRPSGTAKIADKPVDVVADGQYVETGTKVRVVKVEGSRVVVEPIA